MNYSTNPTYARLFLILMATVTAIFFHGNALKFSTGANIEAILSSNEARTTPYVGIRTICAGKKVCEFANRLKISSTYMYRLTISW